MYIRYFVIISPLKSTCSFIWINLNLLHPRCFVPTLVKIGPVVQEKKMTMWKVYKDDDDDDDRRRRRRQWRRTTDKLWSEKLTWAFCSGELKIGNKCSWIVQVRKIQFLNQKHEYFGIYINIYNLDFNNNISKMYLTFN